MTNPASIDFRYFTLVALALVVGTTTLLLPELTFAGTLNAGGGGGTGGAEFNAFYTWIQGAATGYLGRAIAICGGIIGLIVAAAKASILIAFVGVGLGIVGVLGPSIIDALFTTAII